MSQKIKPRNRYLAASLRAQRLKRHILEQGPVASAIGAASVVALAVGMRAITRTVGFSRLRRAIMLVSITKRIVAHCRKNSDASMHPNRETKRSGWN